MIDLENTVCMSIIIMSYMQLLCLMSYNYYVNNIIHEINNSNNYSTYSCIYMSSVVIAVYRPLV